MKTLKTSLVIAILALFLGNTLWAQDTEPVKNKSIEIGFNLIDYGSLNIMSYPNIRPKEVSLVNGIFVKKHVENKSYRFGFSYNGVAVDRAAKHIRIDDTLSVKGDFSRAIIWAGAEKIIHSKKFFQLYWGVDLSLMLAKYSGTSNSILSATSFQSTAANSGVGLTTFMGTRVTIAQRLRLSLEAKLGGVLFNQYERTNLTSTQDETVNSVGYDTLFQGVATVSYLL